MNFIMNYSSELIRLRDFVREIHDYQRSINHLLNSQVVVSNAMVAFALNGLSDADLKTLLESLKTGGQIMSAASDELVFSISFIDANR